MNTTGSKKKRVSCWLSIKGPEDLERALVRMLNRILASDEPTTHAGQFSSLCNSWINCRRLSLESGEWQEIKERLDLVEQAQAFDRRELEDNLVKLKEKVKVFEANY